MIEEIKLNGLDNKPIKTTKKPPPKSINENLPPCYFTSIFIGSKGSGKTYSLIKLLKNYEKYPIYDNEGHKLDMRVIVFWPTVHSVANPIYDTLKYLDEDDIILDYSDDKLLDKLDEIEKEKEEIEDYKKYHYVQKLQSQRSRKLARWVFFRHFWTVHRSKLSRQTPSRTAEISQTSSKMLGNLKQHPLSDSAAPRPYSFYTDQKWLQ